MIPSSSLSFSRSGLSFGVFLILDVSWNICFSSRLEYSVLPMQYSRNSLAVCLVFSGKSLVLSC